jgi:hypothetical protein
LKFIKPILITAVIAAFMLLVYYSWVKSHVVTHGFASYYTSSKMLATGGDIALSYDTAYFFSKMNEYGFGNVKDLANLPTGSLMVLPYTVLDPVNAKVMWNISSIIFLLFSLLFLLKAFEIRINSITSLILILITLLYYPLYYNMIYGQAYALLLLLSSIAVYGFSKKNDYLLGISIALLILFKGYGLFPLAALLLLNKRKVFIITSLFTAALFLLTLPLFGITAWKLFYSNIFPLVCFSKYASNSAYQTFNSLFGHLFSYNAETNPYAFAHIQQKYIYYFLQAAGLILLYFFIQKNPYKMKQDMPADMFSVNFELLIFTASFAFNVIFAPVAEDHHSLLYLPLLLFLLSILFSKQIKSRMNSFFMTAAVLLLCFPVPFRALQNSNFPVYLLSYPRLYGAVLLVIIAYSVLSFHSIKIYRHEIS